MGEAEQLQRLDQREQLVQSRGFPRRRDAAGRRGRYRAARSAARSGPRAAAPARRAGDSRCRSARAWRRAARRGPARSSAACRPGRRSGGTPALSEARGRGSATGISALMRPGSLPKIRMRSAISTASSILCETIRIPLVGMRRCDPQIEQVVAQSLGGQHVERRERLVEQQDVGVDDERAGKADALPHAARQLLRIGVLEPVEADQVDRLDRAPPPLGRRRRPAPRGRARHCRARSATGTARSSGTPSRCRAPARSTGMPRYSTRPSLGGDKPGEDAQEGRFAGARFAEDRDDLASRSVKSTCSSTSRPIWSGVR